MKIKKLIVFGMTMMFVLASCNQHVFQAAYGHAEGEDGEV